MKSAMPRLFLVTSFAVLGLSACGSSNSSSNSGSAPVVTAVGTDAEVLAQFSQVWVTQAGLAGFAADKACVLSVLTKLGAADIQRLRDNINSPTFTEQGQPIVNDGLGKCLAAAAASTTTGVGTSTADSGATTTSAP
ncbi:MAG: hypothetical protein WCK14_03260 [Actinomycetota bacterium]|jgi:hypothetical protein